MTSVRALDGARAGDVGRRLARGAVLVAAGATVLAALGVVGGATLAAGAVAVAAGLLLARRSFPSGEERVWTYLLTGSGTTAVAALVAAALETTGPTRGAGHLGDLVFAVGCLVASPLFYQGLIHWNRVRTTRADPDDWLNGLSGVLVAAGIGNAVLPASVLPRAGLAAWEHQAALCALASGVVLSGTAATLWFISGLRSDQRLWLLVAAMAGLIATPTVVLVPGVADARPAEAVTMLAVGLIGLAAAAARPVIPTVGATAGATTRGSLVVMFIGVGTMVVGGGFDDRPHQLVTAYAGAGVLLVATRLVTLVRDLEQLSETRHQALSDDLTGIGNRRALSRAVERAVTSGQGGALLLLDLDDFKRVNDRYGHATGDDVLLRVAALLMEIAPAGAEVCRLGGDEFAVLLPDATTERALGLSRALVDASRRIGDPEGRALRITASVGLAGVPEEWGHQDGHRHDRDGALRATELLRRADVAMYRAKVGRSGVAVYDPGLDAEVQHEIVLLDDLYETLESDPAADPTADPAADEAIVAFFQPQIDAVTHAVVGAEALARWEHPRHGLLAPDAWLPLAERKGLIKEVTVRMIRQAGAQWRWARDHGYPIRMSVNLSATCLTEPQLIPELERLVLDGIDPAALVLEITESALMADPEAALDRLWAVRERGFGISIDDYGTGFSSLSYLRDLPATELKIDRSFVQRLVGDDRTRRIISATVDLAHGLGMRLVGEGVEDEETLAALQELGCDETQGYLHGRPMSSSDFRAWLLRQKSAADHPVPHQRFGGVP